MFSLRESGCDFKCQDCTSTGKRKGAGSEKTLVGNLIPQLLVIEMDAYPALALLGNTQLALLEMSVFINHTRAVTPFNLLIRRCLCLPEQVL